MEEKIVVRVPDGTKEQLERIAEANERTVSQQIRWIIRELLEGSERVVSR